MESLAKNFSQYFSVKLASSRQQQRFAYAIRYQVYAQELGWEPLNSSCLETDDCDEYAHHCLLEHKRSGDIAGCVRLVLPQIGHPEALLPCQTHEIPMRGQRSLSEFTGRPVGEISRLAVPSQFRRRAHEAGKPFVLDGHNTTSLYTEEERRNFPNISIGLYLAAIAMVEIHELESVLVVMETRLQRHLKRYGLVFDQISEPFELRGTRALFELTADALTVNMSEPILELYRFIQHALTCQFDDLIPPHSEALRSNDSL